MSAIVGLIQLDDSPADERMARAMVERIAHRGPDGTGTFCSGPVALGHLLLQITPESLGERQPLAGADGSLVVAFEGRIDNREDLWESLSVPPGERGKPDASLVLRAYEKWGGECPPRLVGEFAFALWDDRRRELFCVRDALGARRLYYHQGPRRFAFSSEINAVLAVPGVPRKLDERALAYRLGFVKVFGEGTLERTLYEGVMSLPPAHSITIGPGSRVLMRRYWQLTLGPELALRSPGEYGEALRELIERSVAAQLRSTHPVASTLSGGLDSSGVACVTARRLAAQGRRLLTVSGVLPDEFIDDEQLQDERDFIRSVNAQEPNIDPCFIQGDRFPALEFDDRILERLGQPSRDHFDFRTRELVAAAGERGARTLMSGIGGDMAASFNGMGWLAELARRGRLIAMLRQLRLQSRERGIRLLALVRHEVVQPLVPLGARRWLGRMGRSRDAGWYGTAIHPAFAARLGLDDQLRETQDLPLDRRRGLGDLHFRGFSLGENVWASIHSDAVEGLQPLMDRRIWEFAFRVPLEQFCEGGVPRSLYRRAMTGILPDKILGRTTKDSFAPDYRRRLLACRPAMRGFLDAHPPSDSLWGYIHRPSIESALLQLEQPDLPNRWNTSHQLILGRGLRHAHFLSWLRATS